MNKIYLKKQLRKYNIKPNKIMGQNFLIDNDVLKKIIETANLNKDDLVLEVGPGLGILTKKLAEEARQVITIEKDIQIIEVLKQELKNYENIEIICGDALEFIHRTRLDEYALPPSERKGRSSQGTSYSYKVVANIPYYLTSHLIRTLLESENQPKEITILIQKEVAQRICASPPKMTLLATSVQFYSKPKIISYISKECFWPEPKIDSAIIKITNIKKPKGINIKKFFKLVKAGFSSPRKQLINNLSNKLSINKEAIKKALTECNLDIQVRAQNLTIKDWLKLLELTSPSDDRHTNQADRLRIQKNDSGE